MYAPIEVPMAISVYCNTTTSLGMECVEHKDSIPLCHTESLSVCSASQQHIAVDAMPMMHSFFAALIARYMCSDLVHRYTPFSINSCISLFAKSKNSNKASCTANPACV